MLLEVTGGIIRRGATTCVAGGRCSGRARLTDNRPMDITKEVDARGLNCPLPILKAKKALSELTSGQLLRVLSTDPGSVRDFQAFAKQTGNELVEQQSTQDQFVHVLRRR